MSRRERTRPDGPPGLVPTALRRHWRWTLAVTAGLGLALALVLADLDAQTYHRTGVYVVGSLPGADDDALVSANTDRAARDYAAVLQEDEQLLTALGGVVGRDSDGVRARLESAYEPAASTIRVRYRGDSAAEVTAFFDELDRLAGTSELGTSNFPPGVVRPLQSQAGVVTVVDPLAAHPAWGLLGALAVGLAVAVGIERAHPRVAGRRHLQSLTALPVVDARGDTVDALATRLLRGTDCDRIVVRAAAAAREGAAVELADRLGASVGALATAGAGGPPPTVLAESSRPVEDTGTCATVLVVEEGERVGRIESALRAAAGDPQVVLALVDGVSRP